MPGITFEVFEKYGVLSTSSTGWTKELRLVSWNNHSPRYDLREWSPGDDKVSRGIALSLLEMLALRDLLMEMEFPVLQEEREAAGAGTFEEATSTVAYRRGGGAKRKAC